MCREEKGWVTKYIQFFFFWQFSSKRSYGHVAKAQVLHTWVLGSTAVFNFSQMIPL